MEESWNLVLQRKINKYRLMNERELEKEFNHLYVESMSSAPSWVCEACIDEIERLLAEIKEGENGTN